MHCLSVPSPGAETGCTLPFCVFWRAIKKATAPPISTAAMIAPTMVPARAAVEEKVPIVELEDAEAGCWREPGETDGEDGADTVFDCDEVRVLAEESDKDAATVIVCVCDDDIDAV